MKLNSIKLILLSLTVTGPFFVLNGFFSSRNQEVDEYLEKTSSITEKVITLFFFTTAISFAVLYLGIIIIGIISFSGLPEANWLNYLSKILKTPPGLGSLMIIINFLVIWLGV